MSPAQVTIYKMEPELNPAGVEAHIRHSRRILRAGSAINHLSHEEFLTDTKEAKALEASEPGYLYSLALSFGLERDHRMWNDIIFKLYAAGRQFQLPLPLLTA